MPRSWLQRAVVILTLVLLVAAVYLVRVPAGGSRSGDVPQAWDSAAARAAARLHRSLTPATEAKTHRQAALRAAKRRRVLVQRKVTQLIRLDLQRQRRYLWGRAAIGKSAGNVVQVLGHPDHTQRMAARRYWYYRSDNTVEPVEFQLVIAPSGRVLDVNRY
jgi:hypothetical protein